MTDKKTAPRRSVSKPRLLKALLATMADYGLSEEDAVGSLVTAIEQDIIKDALK